MGERWNFNGYIAYPLERIACEILNKDVDEIKGTIFYAPKICGSTFVEAMCELLHAMRGFVGSSEIKGFEERSKAYRGKGYMEIPDDIATELFEDFRKMISHEATDGRNE